MANIENTWYDRKLVKEIIKPNITAIRSRYDTKEQLLLNNGDLVIRNMRFNDMFPAKDSNNTQHKVEGSEVHRPDVIAYNVYGDPRLAWVILSANNISDIFDLEAGMIITIPSSISLYKSGGVMSK